MELGIRKTEIIKELARSPHGKLEAYIPVAKQALKQEPDFFAHLIAWNQKNGSIRDSKVALPIISLSSLAFDAELLDNSLAHIALLNPRELVKAVRFTHQVGIKGNGRSLRRLVVAYLRELESSKDRWAKVAVQHRESLKELYSLCHVKPCGYADQILFKKQYPAGSVFVTIQKLWDMPVKEAAANIMTRRIPFLVAIGALGKKAQDPDLVLALMEQMSPTELVTNTKMLERLGMKNNPALRASFEVGLAKVAKSKKPGLKTTRAIESVQNEGLKEKLRATQQKQMKASGIDGNWLVLGDKSGSMTGAIEVARMVAATLAKFVRGEIHLVFFDTSPYGFDVSGRDYDQIIADTKRVTANGGTSVGCGLRYAVEKNYEIDGIVVVSDGGENHPPVFADVYQRYSDQVGKDVPVYFYRVDGAPDSFSRYMDSKSIEMQTFDLRGSDIDYYSIGNLAKTMNTKRYGLTDQIMDTPLLSVHDVLTHVEVRI